MPRPAEQAFFACLRRRIRTVRGYTASVVKKPPATGQRAVALTTTKQTKDDDVLVPRIERHVLHPTSDSSSPGQASSSPAALLLLFARSSSTVTVRRCLRPEAAAGHWREGEEDRSKAFSG